MLKLDGDIRATANTGTMRHAIHGAAPCPPDIKRAMIAWWGKVIDELYSGTEAVGHTFISSEEWLAHPGSVGRPAANCRIKIVSPTGDPLPPGEPGRILMSNGLEVAYHGAAAVSSKLYEPDGFASLGDVGYLDEDGYLYLTDRQNHMIISGGVNIYPAEIEAELHKMPGVADCGVFGIPDEEYGEAICAVVQPQPGADLTEAEVRSYLRACVAGYKVPKKVDFHAELPREDSGKIFKRKLREPYWAGLDRRI
jgi:long-chain acyl-CoA synthetase